MGWGRAGFAPNKSLGLPGCCHLVSRGDRVCSWGRGLGKVGSWATGQEAGHTLNTPVVLSELNHGILNLPEVLGNAV